MARPMPRLPPVTRTERLTRSTLAQPGRLHPHRAVRRVRIAPAAGRKVAGMRAIQITEFGGPEVLQVVDVPDPTPGDGEQVFDVVAGRDQLRRHPPDRGLLPGQADAAADPGQRGRRPLGGRLAPARVHRQRRRLRASASPSNPARSFAVPDGVDDAAALTTLVQGATAWHLLRTSTHLAPGETVVVHAGAGGVGTIAVQLAKRWGAGRVIATASSADKRQLALDLGADVAVDSTVEDLRGALREANDGRGVDVVLEMTGGRVFDQSLAALAPLGRLATFGMASRRAPTPVEPGPADGPQHRRDRVLAGARGRSGPALLAEAVNDLLAMIDGGRTAPGHRRSLPARRRGRGAPRAARPHQHRKARHLLRFLIAAAANPASTDLSRKRNRKRSLSTARKSDRYCFCRRLFGS